MLSSQGSGKYLMGQWERERARAMRTGTVSGEYSQTQLELSDEELGGVNADLTFETDTIPLDPFTTPKKRDIRDTQGRGQ